MWLEKHTPKNINTNIALHYACHVKCVKYLIKSTKSWLNIKKKNFLN